MDRVVGTAANAGTPAPAEAGPVSNAALIARAMLALRSTGDTGTACSIAGISLVRALNASDYRLLRLDPRTGALRAVDGSGVETPYLAEQGGPVERALDSEAPVLDEGGGPAPREVGLWLEAPEALAVQPLAAAGSVQGLMLVAFAEPHAFTSEERTLMQTLADALALALELDSVRATLADERNRLSRLEQRIHDGEEASSSLMSVVAHEIRSPLTAIKAYTEAMIDSLNNPQAPRQRFLGIINDECDRLTRLVTDILDLSRLEAGQRPLRLARLNFGTLVRETLDGLQPLARARKIDFGIEVEPTLLPEADPDLMRRLLINLVGNAIKYSPAGGRVTVHASNRGDDWLGFVQDTGSGIPAEDLPHVFERFYRGRAPNDQPEVEGSGLGLAIARGIVELHGGRIWVQALEPHGTRFCFALPARQLASAHARRIARQIWNRTDLRELFDHTVEMVAAAMDAEIVSFMLVDPDQGDLFIAASRGLEGQKLLGRRTSIRSGVAGSVAAWGRPLLVNNIETDRRFRRLNHPQYKTKSLLCAPLRVQGEVLGVFNVNNKNSCSAFDEDDLAVLSPLVDRVAGAIERAVAHPESTRIVEEAIEAVRTVTRLKRDCLLGGHDAVHLARAMARELQLSESEADLIGYVASIHDLGMIRLQAKVATPDRLGPEGLKAVETHPEISVAIIRPLEYLSEVHDLILSHHERWDGSGYPRGLAAEAIPLGARILAVVDAFDSMTRPRPYRAPRTREEALTELRNESGRQFDPRVIEALLRVLEREGGLQ